MKSKIFISLILLVSFCMTPFMQSASAVCQYDKPCPPGSSIQIDTLRSNCVISSDDCGCPVTNARTCKTTTANCSSANVIYEHWECNLGSCACEYGGLFGDGEW